MAETLSRTEDLRASIPLELLGCAGMCAAVALRRTVPEWAVWLAWVSASAKGIWLLSPTAEGECVLVLGLMAYTGGRELPPRRALLAVAGGVATVCIVSIAHDDPVGQWIFPIVIFCVVPWFAGRAVRNRVLYGREMEERAARLEALRDEEEAKAVQNERRRIARELHDVVAHSMSVMVIQAGAGRRLAEEDPDQAGVLRRADRAGRARGARRDAPTGRHDLAR